MSPRARKWLLISGVMVVATVVLAWSAVQAVKQVPSFYVEALSRDAASDREASHVMVRKITALAGDTVQGGRWQAIFSTQQINGYLAVDLAEKHPHLLPSRVHDPRVMVRDDSLYVGWRLDGRWNTTVYSLCLVPYVESPNVVAVRIRRIRAGAIPVPLGEVVDGLSAAARESGLRLRWRQEDGDPVALVEIPSTEDESAGELVLDSIALRDGAITLSGHTQRRGVAERSITAEPHAASPQGVRVGDYSTDHEIRHR